VWLWDIRYFLKIKGILAFGVRRRKQNPLKNAPEGLKWKSGFWRKPGRWDIEIEKSLRKISSKAKFFEKIITRGSICEYFLQGGLAWGGIWDRLFQKMLRFWRSVDKKSSENHENREDLGPGDSPRAHIRWKWSVPPPGSFLDTSRASRTSKMDQKRRKFDFSRFLGSIYLLWRAQLPIYRHWRLIC